MDGVVYSAYIMLEQPGPPFSHTDRRLDVSLKSELISFHNEPVKGDSEGLFWLSKNQKK